MHCPGQHNQRLTASYHPCPVCGNLVEIFSDEVRVRCSACKAEVHKEQVPTCVQWCRAARQCVGPERYDAIMRELQEAAGRWHESG